MWGGIGTHPCVICAGFFACHTSHVVALYHWWPDPPFYILLPLSRHWNGRETEGCLIHAFIHSFFRCSRLDQATLLKLEYRAHISLFYVLCSDYYWSRTTAKTTTSTTTRRRTNVIQNCGKLRFLREAIGSFRTEKAALGNRERRAMKIHKQSR